MKRVYIYIYIYIYIYMYIYIYIHTYVHTYTHILFKQGTWFIKSFLKLWYTNHYWYTNHCFLLGVRNKNSKYDRINI